MSADFGSGPARHRQNRRSGMARRATNKQRWGLLGLQVLKINLSNKLWPFYITNILHHLTVYRSALILKCYAY